MITAHTSARSPLAHGLLGLALGLVLAWAPAAFAQTSNSGSLFPTSSTQSRPQSSTSDPNCISIDGGDPNAVHPCGEQAPASQESPDGVAHGAGNPIDVITGNKYQRETDLPALPGVLGIEIVRHYNSAQAGTDAPLGLLGRGWRLSYETDLHVVGEQLHIVQADGARLLFAPDRAQPGRYHHPDPARGWISASTTTGSGPRRTIHHWVWPDGRTLDFDARGKLIQIRMPSGEFLSLTRGVDGELMKVTDPQGRSLSFEYAMRSSRGFRGVVAITSPLGRFTYAHQNERALPGLSNLIAATHPDGGVRRYHYGADNAEAAHIAGAAKAWPHHLTGISLTAAPGARTRDEPGERRLSTYAYDHTGRAILSVRGIARTLDDSGQPRPGTGIEQVELDFAAPDRTVLTNSLGQRTTYRHTRIHGEPRLLEAIGPGCARCGETNVRYQYDVRGRLMLITQLDPAGQPLATTTLKRDAAGRMLRKSVQPFVGGIPLPERVLARYEYADNSPRPALIARPSVVPGREHRLQLAWNDAGQITRMVESGFSPLDVDGEPIDDPKLATPIERSSTFTYTRINGRSLLAATDGPLPNGPKASPTDSDISTLAWDAGGNHISTLTLPGNRVSTIEHDPATGALIGVGNDEGFSTRYTYNLRLQPTTVRHDGPGQTTTQQVHFDYDARGRLVESHNPSSPASNWLQAWDAHGQLRWQASALGVLNTLRYDTEGQLVERSRRSASFEQTESLRYDAHGRLIAVRDNAGRGRDWHYDANGRLLHAIDADGLVHPISAEALHWPQRTASPNHTQRLYDDFGRLVWQRSPDRGTVVHAYDALDRLVALQDARGNRARYAYDAWGRIQRQRITAAGSGVVEETQWRYEGRRLVELIHPTQRERYQYDPRGLRSARMVTLSTARGEFTTVTRYEHDDNGQLVSTTLPDGSRLRHVRNAQGQVVALKRDPVGVSWSIWPTGEQIIAEGFERDLAGMRSYLSGNGIHTLYQRSREGVLARVVHRRVSLPRLETAASSPMELLGRSTREIAERLLGITPAHAQASAPGIDRASGPTIQQAEITILPGALGLADDPAALLDHRYLWDVRGNLLHSRQRAAADGAQPTTSGHAYDRHGRLLTSVRWKTDADTLTEEAVWRFAYDATQRRILSQQGVRSQHELTAGTQATHFEPGTHRRSAASAPVRYTASGQPERWGEREYDWDARGRLTTVRAHGQVLARYRYDHRGLRNSRQVGERTIHTVYDEHRQPLAELDAEGRILRQYVWLADLPLAVIDTPQGVAPAKAEHSVTAQFAEGLYRLLRATFTQPERIVWLHGNHLGAPELATDADGQALWRATYAPFGAATIQARDFSLNLRLPGQIFDAETGLHYNRARYYDPREGQYLTPDPLGTPDGPNPYAYVGFNPLRNVDPDGLILFAFDGTNNSDPPPGVDDFSNVYKFSLAYDQEANGKLWYMNGIGRNDPESEILSNGLDQYDANTARARVDYMLKQLDDYIESRERQDGEMISIDIIGFSRGAAMARDFSNRVATRMQNRHWAAQTDCVEIRFMGLWDTVAQFGPNGSANGLWQLAIPDAARHVFHAVAVNENRYLFPGESIGRGTQRGFVGSHADIGGSYATGDLSDVALNWIVEQAKASGLTMKTWLRIDRDEWGVVTDPVVHDKSIGEEESAFCLRINNERWADQCTSRRSANPGGLNAAQVTAEEFIIARSTPGMDADGASKIVGDVNMEAYAQWLQENYNFVISAEP